MDKIKPAYTRFVGLDIGKATIAVYDSHTGRSTTIANTRSQLNALVKACDTDTLAVCEATGGYEVLCLNVFVNAGMAVHRADARKVKAFIRSYGTLGKTDELDARALARYAHERAAKLSLWRPLPKSRKTLQALVLRRDELVAMRTAEKNRLQAPDNHDVRGSIQALIRHLRRQITTLEKQISALIEETADLRQSQNTMTSVPGVGTVTAAHLLALMPELGTMNRRQIAALAGLAPHPKDSGSHNGYRKVRGGRTHVKRALFMAALCACRVNPALKHSYQSMIKNGKKPIVATTAIMRRLIVIINAKIRDQNKINQLS